MDVKIDLTGTQIETPRLVLRIWRESDLADLYEYASVPGVGEMAGWPHHTSPEASRGILASFIAGKHIFAVTDRETGRVIGSLGLHESWADAVEPYSALRQKEIGYVLSKAYWGRGLMPEAVAAVITWGFESGGLEAFTVAHFSCNPRSRRVIEKCGFHYVRTGVYEAKQLDKCFDDLQYILLKSEWERNRSPI